MLDKNFEITTPFGWSGRIPTGITERDFNHLIKMLELRRKHMNIAFDAFIEQLNLMKPVMLSAPSADEGADFSPTTCPTCGADAPHMEWYRDYEGAGVRRHMELANARDGWCLCPDDFYKGERR